MTLWIKLEVRESTRSRAVGHSGPVAFSRTCARKARRYFRRRGRNLLPWKMMPAPTTKPKSYQLPLLCTS